MSFDVTRKSFLVGAAMLGGSAFTGLAFADAPAADGSGDGAYVGHSVGYKGPLEVLVVIENGEITGVYPGQNEESQGPGTKAFTILGDRVVASQSINVDSVSGATFTSIGYKEALREAVEKSGLIEKFDVAYEAPAVERADGEEYDVVVIGAGGAGMTAALTIKQPAFDGNVAETSVLVLEKQDFPGGSSMLSSAGFAVNDGLRAHDVMDVHTSTDEMVAMCAGRSEQEVNEPLVRRIFDSAADTMNMIVGLGCPYTTAYTSRTRKFLDTTYLQINSNEDIYTVDDHGNKFTIVNEGGYRLVEWLSDKVHQSGVEIRCGAAATELLFEDGALRGVVVEERGASYTVCAKKVILACGGFSQNAEMVNEYNAPLAGIMPYCGGGSDGDGFVMTRDLGVELTGSGAIAYLGVDSAWGISGELAQAIRKTAAIFVTEDGVRVICEPGYDENATVYTACEAPGHHLIGIIDSEHANAPIVEKYLSTGRGFKADTLEELAAAAGIDEAALVQTIEAYNAAYDAGENAEFDTPNDKMTPVRTAPFYAYYINAISIGTMVSLKVDENCQIIGNGAPIEGLYGVGEMCFGGNVLSKTYMGGMSVANTICTGRIAGEHAAATL